VLPADELGDRDLVAVRLEDEPTDDVGQVRAELASVEVVREQRRERGVGGARPLELTRDLRLAARDDGNVVRAAGNREYERVVGRGVTGVQRGDDVRAVCIGVRVRVGIGLARDDERSDRTGRDLEAILTKPRRAVGRGLRQLGTGLDRGERSAAGRSDHELVEQGAEVALARAAVDDLRVAVARERVVDRRAEQADEVPNLLELASCVGVELAVACEEMQVFEQVDRHSLRNVWIGERVRLCHAAP